MRLLVTIAVIISREFAVEIPNRLSNREATGSLPVFIRSLIVEAYVGGFRNEEKAAKKTERITINTRGFQYFL